MLVLLALAACHHDEPADTLLTGGTIHLTVDTTTDALAIRGGVVAGIGDDARALEGPDTDARDLHGSIVYPGFHDAHVHLLAGSFAMDRLLLLGVTSMTRMASEVSDYAATAPDEPWIVGYGWLAENIPNPDGRPITAVVADRPVLLVSNSGHEAIVNQKALDLAGIDASTPDPPDGHIERDPDTGEPTGYLVEGAVSLLSDLVLAAYDDAHLSSALPEKLDEFSRAGITGVSEILAVPGFNIGRPWIYRDLDTAGQLPIRVTYYLPIFKPSDVATVAATGDTYDSDRVRFGGGKIWVDGSMGSSEAYVSQPYIGTTDHGVSYWSPSDLHDAVAAAEAAHIRLKLHANGDAAIGEALDAFEAVANENGGLTETHNIEHAVIPSDDDYARMNQLGLIASVQPTHYVAASFGETAHNLGAERFDKAYDYEAMVNAGIPLADGTDWPVWPAPQPLVVLYNGASNQPPHDLPIVDGLRAYTEGGGEAVGRPDELGRLDVGYLADFVVLDVDPRTVDLAQLSNTTVQEVWVGGKKVR